MAKKVQYEFAGPYIGPVGIVFVLPFLAYFLNSLVRSSTCWE